MNNYASFSLNQTKSEIERQHKRIEALVQARQDRERSEKAERLLAAIRGHGGKPLPESRAGEEEEEAAA